MTPTGLEQSLKSTIQGSKSKTRGAESGALSAVPADLAGIAEAWANLPEAIRDGIVAMVGTVAKPPKSNKPKRGKK